MLLIRSVVLEELFILHFLLLPRLFPLVVRPREVGVRATEGYAGGRNQPDACLAALGTFESFLTGLSELLERAACGAAPVVHN